MSQPVVLISGASRGIGRATAVAMARLGYRLILVARTRADLEETARLAGAPDALCLPGDVTDAEQVRSLVHVAVDRFARLDAVVNVAGLAPVASIEEMTIEQWRRVID